MDTIFRENSKEIDVKICLLLQKASRHQFPMVYALVTHRNDVRNVSGYREERRDEFLRSAMVSSFIAFCIFHFISIPHLTAVMQL